MQIGNRFQSPFSWSGISPWLVLASTGVLACILLILAVKNVNREEEFMKRALLSEANVLMRSLEAGSRTGMMGMGWGQRQLQLLMEETAKQPDVLYVAIVDSNKQIIAHSEQAMVQKELSVTLPEPDGTTTYKLRDQDPKSFEVVRAFRPWLRQQQRRGCPWDTADFQGDQASRFDYRHQKQWFIVVGLDPGPFEAATRQDIHETILVFGVMLLVGAAGFVSIFWAHNYRSTRRSLERMEVFTETVVEQLPVGLMVVDSNGFILRINETGKKILKQEFRGKSNIADFPCFLSLSKELDKGPPLMEREVHCETSQKDFVPLLVNAANIQENEDGRTGKVFLFTDISNIKNLEEQLRRHERLASLGRLAAGIAHEVRNPLSSIKGFAAILANRCSSDEHSRKISDVLVGEVERLNRVVTELLEYARPSELHLRRVSAKEFIEASLRLIEKDAVHQDVGIETIIQPGDLSIKCDPDRFSQVLLNLYLNALQAMPHGGLLKVLVKEEGEELIVNVQDTGQGILPEHLSSIFDPYFTTKANGVGLGLANVHKIVEAHGGKIRVESKPGKGTAMIVSLPRT